MYLATNALGELRGQGWTVEDVTLDAPDNRGSFTGELGEAIAHHRPERVVVTEVGEWRVRQTQASSAGRFALPVDIMSDGRFLYSSADFARCAAGRKALTWPPPTGGAAQKGLPNGVLSDGSSLVTGRTS